MAAFGISGTKRRGLAALFATHPDLDDRIKALESSKHPEHKP
jgi:Zn-dependent protease with chaperone function